MGKVAPCVTVGTVIFAHCSPCAFGNKGSPPVPMTPLFPVHYEAGTLASVIDGHDAIANCSLAAVTIRPGSNPYFLWNETSAVTSAGFRFCQVTHTATRRPSLTELDFK